MSLMRHFYRTAAFTVLSVTILAFCLRSVHATVYHQIRPVFCPLLVSPDQIPPVCTALDRIDILYPGTPKPGIFENITLYSPFIHYETDGESYIRAYPNVPINLSETYDDIPIMTFHTILNWGAPGAPTPFTFVEHNSSGFEVTGVIYNQESDGGIGVPVDKISLMTPYIGLTSTVLIVTVVMALTIRHIKRKNDKK